MGVTSDSNTRAFNSRDIDRFFQRPGLAIDRDPLDYAAPSNSNHVILAVDPSGGGQSAFAIASIAYTSRGHLVVRTHPFTPSPPSPPSPLLHLSFYSTSLTVSSVLGRTLPNSQAAPLATSR